MFLGIIFSAITIASLIIIKFLRSDDPAKDRNKTAWLVFALTLLAYAGLVVLLLTERVQLTTNERGEHIVTRYGPAWPGSTTTIPAPDCQEGERYHVYQQRPGGGNCEDLGPPPICTKGRLVGSTCSQFIDFDETMTFIWKEWSGKTSK